MEAQEKNKMPFWFITILIVIGILISAALAFFIYKMWKKSQEKKKQNLLENSQGSASYSPGGASVSVDLGTKASAIYSAFYENDFFGFSEDEEKAVNELIGVPKPLVKDLSDIYFKVYNKNLKGDFQKYASEDWEKIKHLFN